MAFGIGLNFEEWLLLAGTTDASQPAALLSLLHQYAICGRTHFPNSAQSTVLRKTGAGEGIRTLDPNLGKVVLYP
jgi:hypothetical protein